MVVLAALDFVGAVLAKSGRPSATTGCSPPAGCRSGRCSPVYAVSLRLAELSTVTFGWIVTL